MQLRMRSPEEREEVPTHVGQLMESFQLPTQCSASQERPVKIQCTKSLSKLCDITDSMVYDQAEINEYLHAESPSTCFKSELLKFWKGKKAITQDLPHLLGRPWRFHLQSSMPAASIASKLQDT